ncbi:MAG TPA: NAD-dependent epimerase/dehydratase family protein [Planctomycetia bacterium]|nr:NAD-dependent epimerase/dehydratase family protein [Planctomycetia bacterium]
MILVTGGAGFLGSHLVALIAKRGERVRVLELPGAECRQLEALGAEVFRGDIRDKSSVEEAVRDCDRVCHLAANPNLWTLNRADFDQVNRLGTQHVIDAALAAGAERVLFVSTESILAHGESRPLAVEDREIRDQDVIGTYCRSKLAAERIAFKLAAEGKPVVVAAPTLPVGPGDRLKTPPTRMTLSFCRGEIPAYLDCRFNLIDARDVAAGLLATLDRGVTGRRYVLGAWNVGLVDWLREVGAVVGRPPPRWKVPYALALAAGWFSERWADWITHSSPNATVSGVRLARRNMHFDCSRTLTELDLEPRPLAESARDAVEWYRSRGWLR